MCSPTVKAWALRLSLCWAAASPVCTRTLLKLAPKRGSMWLRKADGKGEPPGRFTRGEAGGCAGAGVRGAWTRWIAPFSVTLRWAVEDAAGAGVRITLRAVC